MSTGLLSPDAALREFSDLGLVLSGAKLHTYVSGTPSTPLATYSESTLVTPNTNPVVASAGGLFGPIYLTPGVAYKYVLADSADSVIWTRDPVMVPADAVTPTAPLVSMATNDFRLTLETGVPVSTTDQTAKTTLFCTPGGRGNRIALFDASGAPTVYSSAQMSIAVPATTSQVYDVFVYNNAGVPTLELLAWTNDTTRATAIVLTTTGCYTKSGDLTRRYVGSFRTTTVSGQTEDSIAKRYVWNYYNRVDRPMRVIDATASWSYTTNTLRQANAAAANQLDFVVGISEDVVLANVIANASDTTSGTFIIGIGLDSTSANATGVTAGMASWSVSGAIYSPTASYRSYPGVGRHTLAWLEAVASGTATTWYGKDKLQTGNSSGISGTVRG